MEDFDFDYHTVTTEYPESGNSLRLGGSYLFTSSPTSPDQRILTLHFSAMKNFSVPSTGVPDVTSYPAINFYRLELFYQRHRMWKSFNYVHAQYGALVCKFSKPLKTPKVISEGGGLLEGFTIELMEQP